MTKAAATKKTGTLHVRIKPHNPKRGFVLKTFVHGPTGTKFEESRGWYVVPRALGEYLRSARQHEGDPDAHEAFDVCTAAEAKLIDAREKREGSRRASAGEATDLTTADLSSGRRKAEAAVEPPQDRRRAPPAKRGPRAMHADASAPAE